jgi:pyrimidine operon attenuation protein / uracil phosphoribosyltransferase
VTAAASQTILDADAIAAAVAKVSEAITRRHAGTKPVFVGIEQGGVPFARRVAAAVEPVLGAVPFGTLDISLYRDDLAGLGKVPQLRGSQIPFDMDGATVILFDDVLYTGRTIRAALEELMDFGRPARVELAVLLDRGCRELPVQADYVGHVRVTAPGDYVRVRLLETDGEDAVVLGTKEAAA